MQEAPNSYEKDEQQERGNYDSANYMKQSHGKAVSRRLSRVRVPYASISRKAGARFETP